MQNNIMAKKFACGDVMKECTWSTAKDEAELFQRIAEHARNTHIT